jgi:spermidine synthase
LGAFFGVFVFGVFPFGAPWLETKSLARLWSGFHLVGIRNSVYGNLAVVETEGSRSLFENGVVVFSVPDPAAAEEAVHYALLEHPAPQSLLLIGGGVNGSLAQALQYSSLKRVDYVELDPTILEIARDFFAKEWATIRGDPRVHLHYADGRLFLKTTALTFDVILVNLPEPQTAQLNRFYTLDFFREAAEKLHAGGILSFQLKASENYISAELGEFLRCIHKTLRAAFPEVTAIPGDTVHFLAANGREILRSDPQQLVSRLRERKIATRYVREYYIPFRMSPDRMSDLEQQIRPQAQTPINRDFAPIAYYFDVALWSTRFHAAYRTVFPVVAGVRFGRIAAAGGALLFLLAALLRWLPAKQRRAGRTAGFCVAAMGFTLIGLEIVLLLGFQAIYGYVYHQLAIVIASFMVGMAAGSWWGLRRADEGEARRDTRREMWALAGLQLLAAISPLALYGLFDPLTRVNGPTGLFVVSQLLFPALALFSGLLGGVQFPIASRVFFAGSKAGAVSPGTLYALDLVGACAGAVLLSAYLIPVFGFLRTALLMAVVNLAPTALAALSAAEARAFQE